MSDLGALQLLGQDRGRSSSNGTVAQRSILFRKTSHSSCRSVSCCTLCGDRPVDSERQKTFKRREEKEQRKREGGEKRTLSTLRAKGAPLENGGLILLVLLSS